MPTSEIVIWSAMLGAIITLLALAVGDAIAHRSRTSLFNVLFVGIVGSSCVVITGLPEELFPGLPGGVMMTLKVSLGPLAGGLALYLLGMWLGGVKEDVLVYRLTAWGSSALFASSLGLLLAAYVQADTLLSLLKLSAYFNAAAVVLTFLVVTRSAFLGDPLARWMNIAVVPLALMTLGLYAKGLQYAGLGQVGWALTAASVIAFFSTVMVLVNLRLQRLRKLSRLLRLELGSDPVTGLPTGSELLSQVDHACWRAARLRSEATVICVHLVNLYQLSEPRVACSDRQVLVAMAARIRRAAGFRSVVGLYHPRCFVIVMTTATSGRNIGKTIEALRVVGNAPIQVVGEWDSRHAFTPIVGVGTIVVKSIGSSSMEVLNEAELLAIHAAGQTTAEDPYTTNTVPGDLTT